MNQGMYHFRYVHCLNMSAERVEWLMGKGNAKEREVKIDFCVTDRFILVLQEALKDLPRLVRSDQIFTKTSTITKPLEDLLSSTDLETEVAEMLVCATHRGHSFKTFAKRISNFVHKEASTLGPKFEMLRITVRLEDKSLIYCNEKFFLRDSFIEFEIVECNSLDIAEACPICLEKLMDSKKHEMVKRTPCKHVFHANCIEIWLKKKLTCPICRFSLPPPKKTKLLEFEFIVTKSEQSWMCEIDFKDLLRVTPDPVCNTQDPVCRLDEYEIVPVQ